MYNDPYEELLPKADPRTKLFTIRIAVCNCPKCGGEHEALHFDPDDGPRPGLTHAAVCPTSGKVFWLNTEATEGVWERFLRAAGVLTQIPPRRLAPTEMGYFTVACHG